MINAWGLAILEEISIYSKDVYRTMDDWIVETVAQENRNMQVILDSLIEFIHGS